MPGNTVNGIREAFAKAIVDKGIDNLFIGLGTGNANWGVLQEFTGAFAADPDNTITLGTSDRIRSVVVRSSDDATTFTENQDYTVDVDTGIITRITSGIIANSATVNVDYYFDEVVPLTQTALRNPLGLKKLSQSDFLVSDGGGTIINGTGTFSVSVDPTNIMLFRGSFLESDYTGNIIREFGLFLEPTVAAGQPPLHFYNPGEITNYGIPLLFENTAAISVGDINKEWTIIV